MRVSEAYKMSGLAKAADVKAALEAGGFVRFTWLNCNRELVDVSGNSRPLDGRTYQAILRWNDIQQTKIGSTEEKNLVIELRLQPRAQ